MQELEGPNEDLQLTFEDEFARREQERVSQGEAVVEEAKRVEIAGIVLPTAEQLLEETSNPANLGERIKGIAGRAVTKGKSDGEAGKWAQRVSRELGLDGKE